MSSSISSLVSSSSSVPRCTSPFSPLSPSVEFHVANTEKLPDCLADIVDFTGQSQRPQGAERIHSSSDSSSSVPKRKATVEWIATDQEKQERLDQIRKKSVGGYTSPTNNSSDSARSLVTVLTAHTVDPHSAMSTSLAPAARIDPDRDTRRSSAPHIVVSGPIIPVDTTSHPHSHPQLHSTEALSQIETLNDVEKEHLGAAEQSDADKEEAQNPPEMDRRYSLSLPPREPFEPKDHIPPPDAQNHHEQQKHTTKESEFDSAKSKHRSGSSAVSESSPDPSTLTSSSSLSSSSISVPNPNTTSDSVSNGRAHGAFISDRVRRFSSSSSSSLNDPKSSSGSGSGSDSVSDSRSESRRGSGTFIAPIIQSYEDRMEEERIQASKLATAKKKE